MIGPQNTCKWSRWRAEHAPSANKPFYHWKSLILANSQRREAIHLRALSSSISTTGQSHQTSLNAYYGMHLLVSTCSIVAPVIYVSFRLNRMYAIIARKHSIVHRTFTLICGHIPTIVHSSVRIVAKDFTKRLTWKFIHMFIQVSTFLFHLCVHVDI